MSFALPSNRARPRSFGGLWVFAAGVLPSAFGVGTGDAVRVNVSARLQALPTPARRVDLL